jgi:hypothetical protein
MVEPATREDERELAKVAESLQAARFWSADYFKYEAVVGKVEEVVEEVPWTTQKINVDLDEVSLEVFEGKGFSSDKFVIFRISSL